MQPNFTLKKLGFVGVRIFALALIFTLSAQVSFSQESRASQNTKNGQVNLSQGNRTSRGVNPQQNEMESAKRRIINSTSNAVNAPISADNDAGMPNRSTTQNRPPSTEAVCATFTGSLAAGDLTMPQRLNRPGGAPSGNCAGGWVFPGTFGTGPYFYDVHTYTNTTGLTQCGTFTLSSTDLTNANIAFGLWDGSFNPLSLATNNIAAPNVSTGTPAADIVLQVTIAAGQTIVIPVWSANTNATAGGTASNYTVTVDFPICASAPCSGTPTPGNTISTVPSACPGVPFTLTLQNSTPGSGVTYAWETATSAAGPWGPAAGSPNAPSWGTSILATTFYRCKVTCSGNTGISTPVGVTLKTPAECYCEPTYTNGCTLGDFIANVTFGSINNTTTCSPSPFYTYYSAIPAPDFIRGGTYPLSVSVGPDTFGQFVGVWIDFNQDGDFNDAGEFVTVPPTNAGANGTVVVNVTIPATAALGQTRLRVRAGDDVAMTAGQSCGASNSSFGEAEDYNINILPCTPAIITTHPLDASIACGGGTTFTAAAAGNVASYQWQVRTDPTVPQTMTFTNNTPLAVPDNSGAGVYSTITVAGIPPGAVISDVSILVNIDHTYVGDMENNIIAPNGVSMSLMAELDNGTGSNSSNNFTNSVFSSSSTTPISGAPAPRTGTFAADRLQGYGPSANVQTSADGMPWSALYSQLNGDWRLGLSDWFAGDVGTLNNWSITFTYTAPTAWTNVTDGGIYSGATTPTLSLSNVSQAYNGNEYRCLITGICSGADPTNAATLNVSAVVPVVDPASATICVGTVQKLSLTNTTSAPVTSMFSTTGLNIPINNANQIIDADVVVSGIPPGSVITNIALGFDMDHTWVGDIGANINTPAGENLNMVWLLDNGGAGNSTANFTGTFVDGISTTPLSGAPAPRTGTFAPDAFTVSGHPLFNTTTNSISDLFTGDPNGNWKFAFYDDFPTLDDGVLKGLYVYITYTAPTFAQGTWTGPAGTMWTDAAATVPYTGTPATTIYVNPTVSSNYQVSFTTTTPCTSTTTTVPVNVVNPVTGVTNPVNTSACVGGTATFSSSASGGPFVRQWQVSTNTGLTWTNIAGATGATLTLTNVAQTMNNNLYRVIYTAAPCAGNVTSTSARLTVNPLPVVTISAPDLALTPGATTTITGTSSPAAISWSWTLDGNPIAGSTNTQVVNINTLGAYQATVVDNQTPGCSASSNILVIGSEASDRLWLYPNPTSGQFQARLYFQGSLTENRIVTIYNSAGQEIMSRRFILNNLTVPYLQMDFDLSKQARGTYVVKVAHEYTAKVVSGLIVVH